MMPLYAVRDDAQLFCLRAPTANMGSLRVGVPIAGSVGHKKPFSTDAHLSSETVRQKRANAACQKPGNIGEQVEALDSF